MIQIQIHLSVKTCLRHFFAMVKLAKVCEKIGHEIELCSVAVTDFSLRFFSNIYSYASVYSPLDRHILRILTRLRRCSHRDVIQTDENNNGSRYDTDTSSATSKYFNCHDCCRCTVSFFTDRSASVGELFLPLSSVAIAVVFVLQFVSLVPISLQLALVVVLRLEFETRLNRFRTLFRSINARSILDYCSPCTIVRCEVRTPTKLSR